MLEYILAILSQPDLFKLILTSLISVLMYLYSNRKLIYRKQYGKLLRKAIIESRNINPIEISNDDKMEYVIRELEKVLPKKLSKNFSRNDLIEITKKSISQLCKRELI